MVEQWGETITALLWVHLPGVNVQGYWKGKGWLTESLQCKQFYLKWGQWEWKDTKRLGN